MISPKMGEVEARFDDLEVFEAIRRTGSLSAAARELRRSPNGVTRSLARLEGSLGVRLFHRTTRSLSLTDEGRRFVPLSESLRATLSRAEAELGPSVERVTGTLRLTASATFARLYLAPIIADLRRDHPALGIELHLSDDIVDLVELGLDAAIRIGPLEDSSLSVLRLSEDRRVLVASPALLADVGMPQQPSDLTRLPCLTLGGPERWRFDGGEVRVTSVVDSNLGDFVLEAARSGLGFAQLASWLVGPSLRQGELVRVLPSHELRASGAVAIVTPSRRRRPARVKALLAAARRHLSPAPWTRHELQ
ncbi:MAG: LysR family transcriptional regulator [Myxococcota bacterium]